MIHELNDVEELNAELDKKYCFYRINLLNYKKVTEWVINQLDEFIDRYKGDIIDTNRRFIPIIQQFIEMRYNDVAINSIKKERDSLIYYINGLKEILLMMKEECGKVDNPNELKVVLNRYKVARPVRLIIDTIEPFLDFLENECGGK